MGRTLFRYIFLDLLKVFMMASGALAGIMSFGGLLRPLTQQGLDAGQVGKMLTYFTFPMMAYSLPVAALFSATVVYGRLSADNELTACRAGGISLGPVFGMAFPGVVFGLLVSIVSLLFLCFVVPIYTLKVERVIYSNLAKLIANRIERTHEIRFGQANIFAQKAHLPPPDPALPHTQLVVLEGVSIVSYHTDDDDPKLKVPRDFMMASSATLYITEGDGDQVSLLVGLEGGSKFPRDAAGGSQIGIASTQFGPVEMPSPIKEDTKFMDVFKLKELYQNPTESRRIKAQVANFLAHDQEVAYLRQVLERLNGPGRSFTFQSESGSGITLTVNESVEAVLEESKRISDPSELLVTGSQPGAITFQRTGPRPTRQEAKDLRLRARPDTRAGVVHVTVELMERLPSGTPVGGRAVKGNYSERITVKMPAEIEKLEDRPLQAYTTPPGPSWERDKFRPDRDRLKRERVVLRNGILSETHGRMSFAVSCFILVMVGCSLGMMFRSGNFLTAFAVSFVPALLCITLIVAGQQTCQAVPWKFETKNPLNLGIGLIWSGNALNLLIASGLLWRLQRQ